MEELIIVTHNKGKLAEAGEIAEQVWHKTGDAKGRHWKARDTG